MCIRDRLWADEVSEAEANSITSRVSAESIPCDNGADSSEMCIRDRVMASGRSDLCCYHLVQLRLHSPIELRFPEVRYGRGARDREI